ncbi:flagellar basal-body MS-ring/collar protein FliF [Legionella drancourtii]|uniref:Flagellar M-ring protein n=1 Tax=Legionella drancourtii LLAP12 TaxID=658187 RepID=G9EQY0_9GAMM|nr:flagellar basal-body MS-ring/collar protein FliF [Legionella drancourtii]EHL30351.1 putative flagellar M-ring protein FliF [Legionella drancourtii LLAP12]
MNYLQTALHWFNHLELKRKLSLTLSFALIFMATIALSWWALSPSYATLFSHLDEQDANKVLSQLEQENISYQVRHGGQDILIDKDLVAKTRLKIMGSGLQLAGNVGFELFDKNDFGMTDFSQKINYQRALQGELERTISSFDEIRQARVHLVIPETHLFDHEENQPKAAITLHLKQALTNQQVRSIQQLVAASVAHLSLKNVVVVDQNGNTLSQTEEDLSSTHFASKKNIEHYLNDKVTQMLHKIFAKNQVMVKINAEINYDELQRELIKPQTKGQITHEKEIKHSTVDKKGKQKGNQDLTLEKTYEFGSEKELFKRASGTIERLSISVVIPQYTDAKTIAQVQRLIKNTVGFNEKRGDVISVEALIAQPVFSTKRPSPILNATPQTAMTISFWETMHTYWDKDKQWQAILALLFFIALSSSGALVLRSIRQKKRQQLLLELTQWLNHHE